jgi:hypothetical protein
LQGWAWSQGRGGSLTSGDDTGGAGQEKQSPRVKGGLACHDLQFTINGVKDMAFDAFRELQIMNDKLLNVGQYTWLNLILTEWGKAYRQAYTTVYGVKQQTASLPWFIGILGGIVGSQAMFVQVSFAPLFVGLSKMTGETSLVDPKVTQKPEDYIDDRKIEFARMLKACSDSFIKLRDTVKDNPDIMTADDFQVFCPGPCCHLYGIRPGNPT